MTGNDRQVFVSGTWHVDRAAEYAEAASRVGALIAAAGWSLACGPGTGVAKHVIDGYRSVTPRVGVVRYFLPAKQHMLAAGEEVQPGADEVIYTDHDYPMRNVWQVSQSRGLIAITGGAGTLEEILPALIDYSLPVAVLKGSGPAASAIELLLDLFPEWRDRLLIGDDPDELVRFIADRLSST